MTLAIGDGENDVGMIQEAAIGVGISVITHFTWSLGSGSKKYRYWKAWGELVSIYSDLCHMGTPPAVINADELQRDPETTLHGLCDDLKLVTFFSFAKFYFFIALKMVQLRT
ncbi:hypothetical protein ARALYDRAFT_347417 [Arabidopsis lyrata subsp. lyrata]|uniref:Uncharacterized protein n=1 Tax=Arabidopsis lyrata subsp. lyrata TaxID=81972 RepID=D7LPD9_ARALL|nr:hypothetical protein ARALYDRAFT_347417 [Arabidopsis lyrata subsp. lyrata]